MERDILEELKEILNREDKKDTHLVSIYTIYKTLERYFDNVFFEAYDNYDLVSKINSSYTNREIRDSRRRGFESPYLKVLDIRSNVFDTKRRKAQIQITFVPFGPENRSYTPKKNILYREDKNIYGVKYNEGSNFCDMLLEKYYDDIDNIFSICDKHSRLNGCFKDINSLYTIRFEDDIYVIEIAFNSFGNVIYNVYLKDNIKSIRPENFKEIRDIINNKKEEIMKRSLIDIDDMDDILKEIILNDPVNKGKIRTRKK